MMKIKKAKAAVAFFVLSALLMLFGFALGLQTATTNYYLETPLPIADYYIGQYTNSSYYAINGTNWDNFLISTNASYIVNTVWASLSGTHQEKILIASDIIIDSPIMIQKNYTTFEVLGNITLANAAECPILWFPSGNVNFLRLIGGVYDGNKDNNDGNIPAGLIIINQTQSGFEDGSNEFHNQYITDTYANGFVYECATGTSSNSAFHLTGMWACSIGAFSVNIIKVVDAVMDFRVVGSPRFQQCAHCVINGGYFNSGADYGFRMLGCNGMKLSNFFMDCGGVEMLYMAATSGCQISNGEFRYIGSSNNTVSLVKMSNATGLSDLGSFYGCKANQFSNLLFESGYPYNVSKYGIEEEYYNAAAGDGSTDGNIFSSLSDYDSSRASLHGVGTAILYKVGANSKADTDTIYGTIAP